MLCVCEEMFKRNNSIIYCHLNSQVRKVILKAESFKFLVLYPIESKVHLCM